MSAKPPLTPMMVQYMAAKEEYPDTVLFFRMGDFYEMFHDDAIVASRVLGLTLTSRSKGDDGVPMAGVPHHAVDRYLRQMMDAGYRVAVCDQVEDPAQAKGIVKREVTRVVTPGTVVEDEFLESRVNNFLAAGFTSKTLGGVAWVDLSTGEFFLEACAAEAMPDMLERITPTECLLPEERLRSDAPFAASLQGRRIGLRTGVYDRDFDLSRAASVLKEHFRVASLDGFGIDEDNPALAPAAALVRYLMETQKSRIRHLRAPKLVDSGEHLVLDRTSQRNLELITTLSGNRDGSLVSVLDVTRTGPGGRLLRQWVIRPLAQLDRIQSRQKAVRECMEDHLLRGEIRDLLDQVADIERIVARTGTGRVNARDLVALGRTLAVLPSLHSALTGIRSDIMTTLAAHFSGWNELREKLDQALAENPPVTLNEGGMFRTGYHAGLDELRDICTGGKDWIARFQANEIERTGISSLKVKYNRVFGYYIEITRTHLDRAPEDYIRKQTLANAERFITPALKEQEEKVLGAQDRITALEYELFVALREEVFAEAQRLQSLASALAQLDVLTTLAEVGAQRHYVIPELDDSREIEMIEARHPVLDSQMPSGEFVANDLSMHPDTARVMIITGPNMAGKSTYIRQCALLIVMAQMGAPVPAKRARIGLVDRVFTRVGASDDLSRGQSTFMVEMNETASILNNASDRSFIVLDEVGRGTSTFDGVSLAWAITEHLHEHCGARCLFATHYHELAELGMILPAAFNANVAVRDWNGEIIFLRKIQPGATDRSYGIQVARLAGIPKPVIERAKVILAELEKEADTRDRNVLGATGTVTPTETLRAAAREVQLTLFDDPHRDDICRELAALSPEKLTLEAALDTLRTLHEKAQRWKHV